jgi:hypothetical protein
MDDPREIMRADRILEEFMTLPGHQQRRVFDAIANIHNTGWAEYNARECHHYKWLWDAITLGGRIAEPPVEFLPLEIAAKTGSGLERKNAKSLKERKRSKQDGEPKGGERFLDLLWTLEDFISRSCPPDTSQGQRANIAAEIVRAIVWDIRRNRRFQRTITPAHVLNNFTRLDAIMNHAFFGLAEGRMLHWLAPTQVEVSCLGSLRRE